MSLGSATVDKYSLCLRKRGEIYMIIEFIQDPKGGERKKPAPEIEPQSPPESPEEEEPVGVPAMGPDEEPFEAPDESPAEAPVEIPTEELSEF